MHWWCHSQRAALLYCQDAHVTRSRRGLHVRSSMTGYTQSSDARMRFRSHDAGLHFAAMFAHPAPSFAAHPFPFPAPIPFSLPTWASTSTPVLAPHRRIPHAPSSTPAPVLEIPTGPVSPVPEESPSPATPAAPLTTIAPTT
ncbi:hypothetical protein HETIRDRAFT_382486, partial [Heterobasidion irregulare TC 32-1]